MCRKAAATEDPLVVWKLTCLCWLLHGSVSCDQSRGAQRLHLHGHWVPVLVGTVMAMLRREHCVTWGSVNTTGMPTPHCNCLLPRHHPIHPSMHVCPSISKFTRNKAYAASKDTPLCLFTSALALIPCRATITIRPRKQPQPRWMGVVLCPNTALCHQVVRLVGSLLDTQGQPVLRACHISSSSPPPFDPPDIVAATPGGLVTLFNDRGFAYGSHWTAEAVSARAAFVVADEADLLCQGGYVKDLTRLLDVSWCAYVHSMHAIRGADNSDMVIVVSTHMPFPCVPFFECHPRLGAWVHGC